MCVLGLLGDVGSDVDLQSRGFNQMRNAGVRPPLSHRRVNRSTTDLSPHLCSHTPCAFVIIGY